MKSRLTLFVTFIVYFNCLIAQDQSLEWFTYYGSDNQDFLVAVAPNADESLFYTVGWAYGPGLEGTPGAHQPFFDAEWDGIISAWDIEGNRIWASYFGGEGFDGFLDVVVAGNGNVIGVGFASSVDGISTEAAFQEEKGDGQGNDGFISCFFEDGLLNWSTYWGGIAGEELFSCTTDDLNHIYVCGRSSSNGLATPNSYQEVLGNELGIGDGLIGKFDSEGDLLWATYFGVEGQDRVLSSLIDDEGNLVIAGTTEGFEGLSTPGAFQENGTEGVDDIFLSKWSSDGGLIWSTYVGGENDEETPSVCIGDNNEIYLAGHTLSESQISTPGSHQEINSGGKRSFLMKFNTDGQREWGTYFGNTTVTSTSDCFFRNNSIYLIGSAEIISTEVVFGENPFQSENNSVGGSLGFEDAYIARFNENGDIYWSTLFGGNGKDVAEEVVVTQEEKIFMVGRNRSTEFYGNSESYQETYGGDFYDGFLALLTDNTVSTRNLDISDQFRIFPNPASNSFQIQSTSFESYRLRLSIRGIDGSVVMKSTSLIPGNRIEFNLPVGMYFVEITNELGQTGIKKLVIQ